MNIGIIGTAGRRGDGLKMTRDTYFLMYQKALHTLQQYSQPVDRNLISGGAAWADHVAVSLYLNSQANSLYLALPATFSFAGIHAAYTEGGGRSPGRVANFHHKIFSERMGKNTMSGIEAALNQGAVCEIFPKGFKARNKIIARKATDLLIAFTWGEGGTPKYGSGTLDTWERSEATVKIHHPLSQIYSQ